MAEPRKAGTVAAIWTGALGVWAKALTVLLVTGLVGWGLWAVLWLLTGARVPVADLLDPPVFPRAAWWFTPVERNGFMRLPVIDGDLEAVAVSPTTGRLVAVGAGGLVVLSDDGGVSWRAAQVEWPLSGADPVSPPRTAPGAPAYEGPEQSAPESGALLAPLLRSATAAEKEVPGKGAESLLPPTGLGVVDDPGASGAAGDTGVAPDSGGSSGAFGAGGDAAVTNGDRAGPEGASGSTGGGFEESGSADSNPVPIRERLHAVAFSSDGRRAVAVGAGEAIVTSDDGGQTWSAYRGPGGRTLRGVVWRPDGWFMALGESGAIYELSEDGMTRLPPSPPWFDTRAFSVGPDGGIVVSGSRGLAVGPVADIGPGTIGYPSSRSGLLALLHLDAQRVVAAGEGGAVALSDDGGKTWRDIDAGVAEALHALAQGPDGRLLAVGAGGTVLESRDRGESWTAQGVPSAATLRGVAFGADGTAYAVGDRGTVLAGTPGGPWRTRTASDRAMLHGVAFDGAGNALAVGGDGTLLRSDDGGASWSMTATGLGKSLNAVARIGVGRLVAVGGGGAIFLLHGPSDELRVPGRAGSGDASNPGSNEACPPDARCLSVLFRSNRQDLDSPELAVQLEPLSQIAEHARRGGCTILVEGFADETGDVPSNLALSERRAGFVRDQLIDVGVDPSSIRAIGRGLSTDSGAGEDRRVDVTACPDSPLEARESALLSVTAVGERDVVAVGEGGRIEVSRDGGETFSSSSGGGDALRGVAARADGAVVAVGDRGIVWRSEDRAESWRRVTRIDPDITLRAVAFTADGAQVVAVGDRGTAAISSDGGLSWTVASTGVDATLHALLPLPDGRLLAGGAAGVLLASADRGRTWAAVPSGTAVSLTAAAVDEAGSIVFVGHGRIVRALAGGAFAPVSHALRPAPWGYAGAVFVAVLAFVFARASSRPVTEREADAGIAGLAASDRPLRAGDLDPLDFGVVAAGLSRFLRNAGTDPPLTMGITGEWGTGKSSLMRLLHEDLAARGFRPVWFNAWHHQKGEQLMASLFAHIRAQGVPTLFSRLGLRYRARLLWRRGRERWMRYGLLAAAFAFAVLYGFKNGDAAGALFEGLGKAYQDDGWVGSVSVLFGAIGLKGAGVIAAIVVPLLAALRALRAFGMSPAALMTGVAGAARNAEHRERPGARYTFAREFADVTSALRPYTMVIFIDDLDRCSRDVVPEVLETVNFLMTSGDCFVVLGMARGWVETCVGLAFKELAEEMDDGEERRSGRAGDTDGRREAVRSASMPRDHAAMEAAGRARPDDASTADSVEDAGVHQSDAAASPSDGKRMRRDFARDYLEKLLNVEVPVPVASAEGTLKLLAPEENAARPARVHRLRRALGEIAPALGLAAVVGAGALVGLQAPPVSVVSKPAEIRAEAGRLVIRAPAAGDPALGAGLEIPVVRRRAPAHEPGQAVVLGQVTFEGARGHVAIEFGDGAGGAARPQSEDGGTERRRITLGTLATEPVPAQLVLRLGSREAPAASGPATPIPPGAGREVYTTRPPPLDDGASLGEEAATLEPGLAQPPVGSWVLAGATALLVSLIGWLTVTPRGVVERDSPAFLEALRLWHPWIVLRRNTPRAVKRYLNLVRYVAMRARPEDDDARGAMPEPVAVALAALDGLSVEHPWVRSAQRFERLARGDYAALLAESFAGEREEVDAAAKRLEALVEQHRAHDGFQAPDRDLFRAAYRDCYVKVMGEVRDT